MNPDLLRETLVLQSRCCVSLTDILECFVFSWNSLAMFVFEFSSNVTLPSMNRRLYSCRKAIADSWPLTQGDSLLHPSRILNLGSPGFLPMRGAGKNSQYWFLGHVQPHQWCREAAPSVKNVVIGTVRGENFCGKHVSLLQKRV